MTIIPTTIRRALETYDASYPPDILNGGTDPHITTITPSTTALDSGGTTATLEGRNFAADSVVEINQAEVQSVFNSATQMQFETDLDTLGVGVHGVTVRNADDEESNTASFTITAAAPPTLTSLDPTTVVAGVNGIVQIHGTGFAGNATVTFNGANVPVDTNFGPTRIDVIYTAASAGTISVAVQNPTSGTATNTLPLTVTAAAEEEPEPTDTDGTPYDTPPAEPERTAPKRRASRRPKNDS